MPVGARSPSTHRLRTVVVVGIVVVAGLLVGNLGLGALPRHGSRSPATEESATGTPLDPSRFANGACEAFSPTSGDRHETVFLDAGHGGIDPGGVGETESGQTITEASETLPTELDAMALLRADGYRVVVSRTEDTTVLRLQPDDVYQGSFSILGTHDDVAARDVCANMAHADVLVGIYFDANQSPSVGGSLTAYDPTRSFRVANERLATFVQDHTLAAMNAQGWQIPNDGVDPDGALGSAVDDPSSSLAEKALNYHHILLLGPAEAGYFSTPSRMPGALIEPLYLTDPFEGSIANSAFGQHVIASGIAHGIEQYLSGTTR